MRLLYHGESQRLSSILSLVSLFVFGVLGSAVALKTESSIIQYQSSVFLDSFAFDKTTSATESSGTITYDVTFPPIAHPSLLIFFLTEYGVDDVSGLDKLLYGAIPCAGLGKDANVVIDLAANSVVAGSMLQSKGAYQMPRTNSLAAKWVLLALANCNMSCYGSECEGPIFNFTYIIEVTNANEDFLVNQVSAEDLGILEQFVAFFVLENLLLLATVKISKVLHRRGKFHETFQLVVGSIAFQYIAVLFGLGYYGAYCSSGHRTSYNYMQVIGKFFFGFGEMTMILHLILIGKGWTIVRRKISANGRVKVAVYMTVYYTVFWAVMLWSARGDNTVAIRSFYETSPGYILILIRCLAAAWFCYSVSTTLRNYTSKRRFYFKFMLAGALWFLWVPCSCALASTMAPHLRNKFLTCMELLALFVVQTTVVALYNPYGRYNQSFPFHQNSPESFGKADKLQAAIKGEGSPRKQSMGRVISLQPKAAPPGATLSAEKQDKLSAELLRDNSQSNSQTQPSTQAQPAPPQPIKDGEDKPSASLFSDKQWEVKQPVSLAHLRKLSLMMKEELDHMLENAEDLCNTFDDMESSDDEEFDRVRSGSIVRPRFDAKGNPMSFGRDSLPSEAVKKVEIDAGFKEPPKPKKPVVDEDFEQFLRPEFKSGERHKGREKKDEAVEEKSSGSRSSEKGRRASLAWGDGQSQPKLEAEAATGGSKGDKDGFRGAK